MNPSQSFQLQMQALRQALERSARATLLAEEHTVRALSDLQMERSRARELDKEVSRLTQRHAMLLSENRRLRNLVGEACQDRNSLSTELKAMLKEFEDFSAEMTRDTPDIRFEQRRDAA
jgi:small-conductance mechanosensitive channel